MADNNFTGVIESLMKGMNAVLSTKTVVGEATQIGDSSRSKRDRLYRRSDQPPSCAASHKRK